jgi:hypothetical protein
MCGNAILEARPMTFERARKTRDYLLANEREPVAAIIGRAFERAGRTMQSVIDVENAIALLPDVELRERYAAAAWRYFDVLRSYFDDSLVPSSGKTWIVAVPFTVESPELMLGTSAKALAALGGRALTEAFIKNADPACPHLLPTIHVVPVTRVVFLGAATYGFMLANPHNRIVDEFLIPAWRDAAQSYRHGRYFVPSFCFLFPVTELGLSDEEQMSPHHALPQSHWLDQQMAVLRSHVADVQSQLPELGVKLGQPMRLSSALVEATRLRLARQFQDMVIHQQIDQALKPQRDLLGQPVVEDLFHRVLVEVMVRPGQQMATQSGCVCTFARQGPLTTWMLSELPLGYPVSLLSQAWRGSAIAHQVSEVIELPSLSLEHVPLNAKGDFLIRNGMGNWVEGELMRMGADAEVLRTLSWQSLLGSHPAQISPQERERLKHLPVPELMNQKLKFPDVVRQRYRADVAAFLENVMAEPGVSFSTGYQRVCKAFPEFTRLPPSASCEPVPWPGMWSNWHFAAVRGPLFRVREALVQRLDLTDIEHGFPSSFVHSPYPDCYFTLQTPLGSGDGRFRILGFYVSERRLSPQECADRQWPEGSRAVSLTLAHEENDAFISIDAAVSAEWMIKPDDTSDFNAKLQEAFNSLDNKFAAGEQRTATERNLERHALLLACKVLVYVGLKNARLVQRPQRSMLLSQARQAKGREKDRLLARAHNVVDYIDVGPEQALPQLEPCANGHSDRSMRPHWRRGHYRPQAFGPGRTERRTVWIEPVLVRADRLAGGDEQPPKPDYIVH